VFINSCFSYGNADLQVFTFFFGRCPSVGTVHIIINNAGILRDTSLSKQTAKDWDIIQKVHLQGTYSTVKAAWDMMRKQKYGRIVNVSSGAGIYGNFGQTNYSAAKLGIAGFSFAAAREGEAKNIKVNCIAPVAGSRMTETVMPADMIEALKPEFVAPMVAYLVHEDVDSNGGLYELGGGWISKLRWQRTAGGFFNIKTGFTPEDVQSNFETICDFDTDEVETPDQINAAFGPIMENMSKY
jgi:NAD(P)-dependent dehydrogenase (short-subunit alcohol dehydrogenase family)